MSASKPTTGLVAKFVSSPAHTILHSWNRYEKQDARMEWSMGLPEQWIEEFVRDGIIPFLQSRGYVLRYELKDCSRHLYNWAFAHVWVSRPENRALHINYSVPQPGTLDDYVFFSMKVDAFDCTELMDTWTSYQFFDESPAGRAQRMEFQTFLWRIVNLDRSKTHRRWREWFDTQHEDDSEENAYMQSLQEDGSRAYGGDRRTY